MHPQLGHLQEDWEMNVEKIRILLATIDTLEERDELYWLQHSKIKWLREGDSILHFFFHQTTIQR